MSARRGWHRRRRELDWRNCDRCGKRTPVGKLARQDGFLVCTDRCYDEPSATPRIARMTQPTFTEGLDYPVSIEH